jgi:hypothetical protein
MLKHHSISLLSKILPGVFILGALFAGSCSSAPAASTPTSTTQVLPATVTAAALEGFYATRQANDQATIVARATASPFPTARPVTLVQGQPSEARGQREGLILEVDLPKDSYIAGEGGLAELTIRNEGPETVFINGSGDDLASLGLLDERGRRPDVWPLSFSRYMSRRPYLQKLAPGDVVSKTLQFQIPPPEQKPSSLLYFWAETRFSRPALDNPQGPDNLWLRLEAGPVKLNIIPPSSSNYLKVDWQFDRRGWHLSVKSANGQIPSGQFWGEIGAASPNSLCVGPLRDEHSKPGEWAGSWQGSSLSDNVQVIAGGWIATAGYVTEEFSSTLPGEGDAGQMLGLSAPGPKREDYSSIKRAQAAVDFPIFALAPLLSGSTLENVHIEKCCGKEIGSTSVEQQIKLADGNWMALTETSSPTYANGGWGVARYEWEALQADVRGQTAYAIQRFGWWYLDWKIGDLTLELRAPTAELSLTDLLRIARQLSTQ